MQIFVLLLCVGSSLGLLDPIFQISTLPPIIKEPGDYVFQELGNLNLSYKDYPKTYPHEYYMAFNARTAVCNPSDEIRKPTSIAEVQAIVLEAIAAGKTVKAFGTRGSTPDIICTDGIPIDMQGIKLLRLNPDNSVTVGAGNLIRDLKEFLHANGRAIESTPEYAGITIGGSIGTSSHGSTIMRKSTLSEHVIGMTIIDGKGAIRVISHEEELVGFRTHLGLLGIIIDVTFETREEYKMKIHNYLTTEEIFTNGVADDLLATGAHNIFHWFPARGEVIVMHGTEVSVDTPGEAFTNNHVPSISPTVQAIASSGFEKAQIENNQGALNILEAYLARVLYQQTAEFVPDYTEDNSHFINPGVGFSNSMLTSDCHKQRSAITGFNICPFQPPFPLKTHDISISVGVSDLTNIMKDIKIMLNKRPAAFPVFGILMRFSKNTTSLMSNAYGKDVCNLEFFGVRRYAEFKDPYAGMETYEAMMQLLGDKYVGRAHWGKTPSIFHSRAALARKLGPGTARVDAFKEIMDKYDPNGLFSNKFRGRLLGESDTFDSDPLMKYCALYDDCICQTNSDCPAQMQCSTFPDTSYKVCKSTDPIQVVTTDYTIVETTTFAAWLFTYLQKDVPYIVPYLGLV